MTFIHQSTSKSWLPLKAIFKQIRNQYQLHWNPWVTNLSCMHTCAQPLFATSDWKSFPHSNLESHYLFPSIITWKAALYLKSLYLTWIQPPFPSHPIPPHPILSLSPNNQGTNTLAYVIHFSNKVKPSYLWKTLCVQCGAARQLVSSSTGLRDLWF